MNTRSASPVEAAPRSDGRAPAQGRILVWDAPVRVFHWLMALSFVGAYLTAEIERWRLVHVTLGYTMAGLVVFRILWGFVGTRHARFADFVRGPAAVMRYLRSLVGGSPEHHAGHNPAGAWAILALLAMTVVVTAAGWATYNEVGGLPWEDLHEGAANAMLALVGVHVAGVLLASWLHRSNLVATMVSGWRAGPPHEGVRRAWRSVAVLMLAAVVGFWAVQWQAAPPAGASDRPAASAKHHDRDDD